MPELTTKLKLLFVNKVSPQLGGGSELRLKNLISELSKYGHQVTVVSGQTKVDEPRRYRLNGATVLVVPTLPKFLFRWRFSFYLSRAFFYVTSVRLIHRLLRVQRWDYIIDGLSPLPSAAFPLSRLHHVACAAEVPECPTIKWARTRGLLGGLAGIVTMTALKLFPYSPVIAGSEGTAQALRRLGVRHVEAVPQAISKPLSSSRSPGRANQLVMAGRLVPQKGHLVAIRAFSRVVKHNRSLYLTIIGDGPYRARIDSEITRCQLNGRVEVKGWVTEKEKWKILRSARLFLFPSLEEGFGIALLEAMSVGLPVVCSDLPVFREFFKTGYNGIAVPPGDAGKLAEAIAWLLDQPPLMKEMSKRNKQIAQRYSWPKVAKRLENVLLDTRRPQA